MKPYLCPLEAALSKIGGKYKMPIIYHLMCSGVLRFGQLRKRMPEATPKMLTQQLRLLEEDGIVHREVYPEVPPRTEYSLTDLGKSLGPIIYEMAMWSIENMPGTFYVWDEVNEKLMDDESSDAFMRAAADAPEGLRAAFAKHMNLNQEVLASRTN